MRRRLGSPGVREKKLHAEQLAQLSEFPSSSVATQVMECGDVTKLFGNGYVCGIATQDWP